MKIELIQLKYFSISNKCSQQNDFVQATKMADTKFYGILHKWYDLSGTRFYNIF